jgi:hypothetical protein
VTLTPLEVLLVASGRADERLRQASILKTIWTPCIYSMKAPAALKIRGWTLPHGSLYQMAVVMSHTNDSKQFPGHSFTLSLVFGESFHFNDADALAVEASAALSGNLPETESSTETAGILLDVTGN